MSNTYIQIYANSISKHIYVFMIYIKCQCVRAYTSVYISHICICLWLVLTQRAKTYRRKSAYRTRQNQIIESSGARTKNRNNGHAGMSFWAQLLSSHWGNSCEVCGQQTSQSHTYKNCRSWSHPCRGFPPFIWPVIHLPGHTVPGLCLNKAHTVPVFSHHAAGRQTEPGTYAKVFKGCPET